ncbi:alpha/beta fold hydrolase [Candidatus Parcubacteria bacterium]|nr:alpha/beta fold hydrolase [Candidatus Parcubacteria bacterium]
MQKKIHFNNTKGDRLSGIISNPTDDTSRPVIILCHGFTTSKDNFTNSNLERILNKSSISTFRFDFFGHGESEGLFEDITISEAVDDIVNAIKYLKSKSYSKIGLVGSSFGGIASIMTASKTDDLFLLALKAPVSNYKERDIEIKGENFINDWKEKGHRIYVSGNGNKHKLNFTFCEDYDNNNGYEAAKKIKIPTLIVHGDKDESVPIEQSRKIVALIQNSELVEIKDGGHQFNNPGEFNKMLDLISSFIIKQCNKE